MTPRSPSPFHPTATRLLVGSITTAAVAAVLAGCTSSASVPPDDRSPARTSAPTGSPAAPGSPADPDGDARPASYRDGTYEATGWYGGLPSHHDVELTLVDDEVTQVSVSTPAEDPTSLEYQQAFAAAVPGEVIGRRVDEIQIDRLAGASGCPDGFMDALEQIKAEAAV